MRDETQSIQERLAYLWDHEFDERMKAHIERLAREMDCLACDILWECQDLFLHEPDFLWDIDD
jgi:hypothetical protein